MANRRISEFPAISGIDIDNQDLLTLVHVFEVNPTLRNKKLTFTEFRSYLDQYYANTSGATISGNVTITGNLSVSGTSTFNAITATGASTFSGIVVQNNATVSGTISGATITGNALQSTTLNAGTVTTTTATGTTALFTSGLYQTLSGATITGNNLSATSGVFTALSGTTITGTTVAATTGAFQTLSTPVLNVSGNLSVASGLTVTGIAQFANGVQVTGTLSGTTITGTTAQFTTVTGVTGVYTTLLSGATLTGNTARFSNVTGVSGTFTTRVSGATVTGNTGAFGNISGISGVFTQVLSGAFITGNTGNYTTLTGVSGTFANLSGTTITGTNVSATTVSGVSGVFTSRVSGTTITGTSGVFSVVNGVSGTFTTQLSGSTITGDSANFTRVTGTTGTFTTIVSGLTVTGNTGAFTNLTGIAGVFTTSVSGATVTGNTVQGTSGVFVNLSGTTITGTTVNAATGVFNTLQATNLAFINTTVSGDLRVLGSGFFSSGVQITGTLSGITITGTTVQSTTGTFVSLTGTTVQSTTGTFVSLTGTTTSGTTANFVSGVFSTQISGVTVTGTTANFTSGNFTNISGGTYTITSGVFASGTAANPSISFVSDEDTGVYAPGANQVAISTNGTGRLFVDANGNVGISQSSPTSRLHLTGNNAGLTLSEGTALGRIQTDAGGSLVYSADVNNAAGTNGHLFLADGTERMRLTSAGSLGLGTSSPGALFHIEAAGNTVNQRIFTSDNVLNATASLTFGTTPGTRSKAAVQMVNTNTGNASGALALQTNGGSGLTTRLYINDAGSVGIGTTAPAEALDVVGNIQTSTRVYTGTGTQAFPAYSTTNDLDTGIWFPAANQLAIGTGGSERARIDSSGRLLVGTSSGNGLFNGGTQNPQFQIEGTTGNTSLASLTANRNDAAGPTFYLAHSRGTAAGGTTVVQSGDQLGILAFAGTDGTDYITGATITANVDGTPGANDMPGRLVFSTTADGAVSPTERMRIDSSGRVGIGTTAPSSLLHVNQPGVTPGEYGVRVSQQSATGNALKLTIDSANALSGLMQESTIPLVFGVNNIERARIDTSGRLLVGTSTSFDLNAGVQSVGTGAYRFEGFRFGSDNGIMVLGSANGTQASPSVLTSPNFGLGIIQFRSYDGAAYRDGAWISAVAESEWASSDCPTRLTFSTTADGASSPTERMRIDSSGRVGIGPTSPNQLLHISASSGAAFRFEALTSSLALDSVVGEIEFEANDGSAQGTGIKAKLGAYSDVATGNSVGLRFFAGSTTETTGTERYRITADGGHIFSGVGAAERARIDSSGRLLVGTSSQSGGSLLQVNDNRIRIATAKTPASATDTGVAGEICWDANYVYVCTATNTWKRTAISTW